MVKDKDLKLGDIVKLSNGPYGYATVKNIRDDKITFFRPYVHASDFAFSFGIICYIGIEEFDVSVSGREYEVIESGKTFK